MEARCLNSIIFERTRPRCQSSYVPTGVHWLLIRKLHRSSTLRNAVYLGEYTNQKRNNTRDFDSDLPSPFTHQELVVGWMALRDIAVLICIRYVVDKRAISPFLESVRG